MAVKNKCMKKGSRKEVKQEGVGPPSKKDWYNEKALGNFLLKSFEKYYS